jgi:XTP/dITP diphosphohydrolase
MEIVLATRNRDKIREIEAILSPLDIEVLTLDRFDGVPEVVEDGATLEENALKKARTVRDHTGVSALADDTGLEVDALGGAPGVYSSRYAGEEATYDDNNRKLLKELRSVEAPERSARFRCVMALALTKEAAEKVLASPASVGEGAVGGAVESAPSSRSRRTAW